MPKKKLDLTNCDCQPVEILAVNVANVNVKGKAKPHFLLTIRQKPKQSFGSINLAITQSQGERLIADIQSLRCTSQLLKRKKK